MGDELVLGEQRLEELRAFAGSALKKARAASGAGSEG
jgi:hypothetical protein